LYQKGCLFEMEVKKVLRTEFCGDLDQI